MPFVHRLRWWVSPLLFGVFVDNQILVVLLFETNIAAFDLDYHQYVVTVVICNANLLQHVA